MDINNLLLRQALTLSLENSSTQKLIFKMDELTNCSIGNSVDETPVAGSGGTPIAILKSNKTSTVTASNGYVVFDAVGAQAGQVKESGSYNVPWDETIDFAPGATSVTLSYKAIGTAGAEFPYIYEVNNDGTPNIGKAYTMASAATASEFSYDPATGKITLPTGFAGSRVYVRYTARASDSMKIENRSNRFSLGGRATIKWLAEDPCDESKLYIVLTVLDKATVSGTYDLAAGNDVQAHDITLTALAGGCSTDKTLWKMFLLTSDGLEPVA